MSLFYRIIFLVVLLLLPLVCLVSCAQHTLEKDGLCPPSDEDLSVVEIVVGKRVSIERQQAEALVFLGGPLELHSSILALRWTQATIDYPLVYVYNWDQGESHVLEIQTGKIVTSGDKIVTMLKDKWREVTAGEWGSFENHRFGVTLWVEHRPLLARAVEFSKGAPIGEERLHYGEQVQGFLLETSPAGAAITFVGYYKESGEVFFFRPLKERGESLTWSPRGTHMAVATRSAEIGCRLSAFEQGTVDPLFSLTGQDVAKALSPETQYDLQSNSFRWSPDERILHFQVHPKEQAEDSFLLSVWSDGTGLELVGGGPDDEEIQIQYGRAMKEYWAAVQARSVSKAMLLPETVVVPTSGTRIALRESALQLLQDKHLVDLGGIFLVSDPKEPVTLPLRVKIWHNTNHYSGSTLAIVDESESVLVKYRLREVSTYNEILYPVELVLSIAVPTTDSGFIVGLSWNAKDGEEPLDSGERVPVSFKK